MTHEDRDEPSGNPSTQDNSTLGTVGYLGVQDSESAKLAWWSRRGGGVRPLLGQCFKGGTEFLSVI